MPNDIVVRSDKDGGKVHLSADRVYDLNEDKTQDVINSEFKTLMNLDSEVAIVIDGRSCTLGAVAGQYVILQNSTIAGKSDGLYTAAQTIPTGATNVTAEMLSSPIPRGGLNSLKTALNSIDDLNNKRVLGNGDDLNDLYGDNATGVYYITSGVANCPTSWSSMICTSGGEGPGFQLIFGSTLFVRRRVGNPPSWSQWEDLDALIASRVAKTGDVMTGILSIKTGLSPSTPSSSQYAGLIYGINSQNTIISSLQISHDTSGVISTALQVERPVSGGTHYHSVRLGIDTNGNDVVSCNSPAWRSALQVNKINRITKSVTTDQYGQASLASPITSANFINCYSDNYQYVVVKQSGTQIRVFGNNMTFAANVTLNVTILYTE